MEKLIDTLQSEFYESTELGDDVTKDWLRLYDFERKDIYIIRFLGKIDRYNPNFTNPQS